MDFQTLFQTWILALALATLFNEDFNDIITGYQEITEIKSSKC